MIKKDVDKFVILEAIRSNKDVLEVEKLQSLLYSIDSDNYSITLKQILNISFNKNTKKRALVKSLIRSSSFYPSKNDLYFKLAKDIDSQIGISEHLSDENKIFDVIGDVEFKKMIYNWLNEKFTCDELSNYEIIIRKDNITKFLNYAQAIKFNKNKIIKNDSILYDKTKITLIEYAAICGAIKIFKYLYLNNATLGDNIFDYAVIGGCIDIAEFLTQEGLKPSFNHFEYAIKFHRVEIFDWLFEQFEEKVDASLFSKCISHNFIHGIMKIDEIDVNDTIVESSKAGLFYLVKIFSAYW